FLHQGNGNPRLVGSAGTGREDDCIRPKRDGLFDGYLVGADRSALDAQFADIAREVVNEAVEIVDEKDHPCSSSRTASAAASPPPSARRIARALASVSSYSEAGSESATMPPPAWKVTRRPFTTMVRIAIDVSMFPSAP